jgi:hypothetical protein
LDVKSFGNYEITVSHRGRRWAWAVTFVEEVMAHGTEPGKRGAIAAARDAKMSLTRMLKASFCDSCRTN